MQFFVDKPHVLKYLDLYRFELDVISIDFGSGTIDFSIFRAHSVL